MKKKQLLAVVLSCVALALAMVIFAGCNNNLYSDLSKVANAQYANVSVKITTEQNGTTLTSTFDVKNSDSNSVVNYSVQKVAPIDPDASVSDSDTITSVGTVTLQNGEVKEQSGDPMSVNFGDVTKLSLRFVEKNFDNVNDANGIFSAKVIRPQVFMNASNLQCSDMTVTFDYDGATEHLIIIHYTSQSGAAVTLMYTLS